MQFMFSAKGSNKENIHVAKEKFKEQTFSLP